VYYAINRDEMGYRSDENLRLLEFAAKESRDGNLPSHEIADVLYNLGTDLEWRGRLDEAEPIFNQALQLYLKDPLAVCDQSAVYSRLAVLQDARGFVQASLPLYQRAYDGYKTCSGPDSLGVLEQQAHIAGALIKLNRAPEAVPMLEKTLPAWRKIVGSGPQLSGPLCLLSKGYLELGRYPEAEKAAKEAVDIQGGKNRACGSTDWQVPSDVGAGVGRTRPLSRGAAACPDCRYAARKECDFGWRKARSIRSASGAGHRAGRAGRAVGDVPVEQQKAKHILRIADDASW
jgi:tetratricopeptide (TPR) repeat protein